MFQFPAFASHNLCIQSWDTCLTAGGLPHSEIPGSQVVCYLPETYRKLQRPSSPLAAKASTVYASSLDHITQNSLPLALQAESSWSYSSNASVSPKDASIVFKTLTSCFDSTSLSIFLKNTHQTRHHGAFLTGLKKPEANVFDMAQGTWF